MKKALINRNTYIILLIILISMIFTLINPVFLSSSNLFNLLKQIAIIGILSVAMTLVLLTGGIELSMGSVMSFLCVTISLYVTNYNIPYLLAMFIGILTAVFVGFINGYLIAKLKVPALIMTLGMQITLSGITYTICGGLPVYGIPNSLKLISQIQIYKIPLSAVIMIVTIIIGDFILRKTYLGRYIYSVGSNEEATVLSGIRTTNIKLISYCLSGLITGLAGIVLLSRVGSGQPSAGEGYEMDVLTACVLGGVSLNGGQGNLLGAFLGVLLIGILGNGMSMAGMGDFHQRVVKGIVLIVAVVLDSIQNRKRDNR